MLFYGNIYFFKVCFGFMEWFLSALSLLNIIFSMKRGFSGKGEGEKILQVYVFKAVKILKMHT